MRTATSVSIDRQALSGSSGAACSLLPVETRARLFGTRLALLGALLYLSEWLVIPFVADLPTDDLGDDASAIAAEYAGHGTELAFLAGWLSFALLGRILFVAALRSAFRESAGARILLDVAVAAMAVSVAVEIVQLGLVATAGWLAEAGADPSAIAGLDAAATVLFGLVLAPVGASVLAGSVAMVASGLFPRWVGWLGVIAGALVVVGGVVSTTGAGDSGTVADLADPLTGPPVALFWIWMLATSIVLFRNVPPNPR
jgi:ethanolamine utilization microcompartment shell protein EutS